LTPSWLFRSGSTTRFAGGVRGFVGPSGIDSNPSRSIGIPRRARALVRKYLPSTVLHLLHEIRLRRQLRSAGPIRSAGDDGHVTVLGFLTAPTGLGEGARLCAASLAELGYTVGLIDASPLLDVAGDVPMPRHSRNLVTGDVGGPLICHLNPPELRAALALLHLSGQHRKLIGYWAWELPVVPRGWRKAFRLVHEIWVPSSFVADALRRSRCAVPIRLVPHPLATRASTPVPPRVVPDILTVLTVFAHESGFDRKNPLAAVDAFRAAFGDREDVRLIVKVRGQSVSGAPERRLAAHVDGARNIVVMDRQISHQDMLRLLAAADIFLSLHRAEGFGIPLAQAMLMGKPVVATGWSGNLEFMNEAVACLVPATMIAAADESSAYRGMRASWADPSIPAAAAWLRRLDTPEQRHRIGTAGRAYASERLGLRGFADAVASSLTPPPRRVMVTPPRHPVHAR
jgi:glycosyltransferase involved in cell wall biosynthesis